MGRADAPAGRAVSKRLLAGATVGVLVAGLGGWWLVRADVTTIDAPATAYAPAVRITTTVPAGTNRSLRFYGTGSGGIDRVVVPLGAGTAANVGGGDFTVEFSINGALASNPATGCNTGNDAWINGHVVIDRDVYGGGDYGDYGISLLGGKVAFGVSNGGAGATVCGTTTVLNNAWHHVAVTRRASDGRMQVWVDGVLDGSNRLITGERQCLLPGGSFHLVSGRSHARVRRREARRRLGLPVVQRLARRGPRLHHHPLQRRVHPPHGTLAVDASTATLYHFDAGSGTAVADAVGTSSGTRQVGGPSSGPTWSTDAPFA